MSGTTPASPTPGLTLNPRGIAELAARAQQIAAGQRERAVLAIAGIPGGGKSTLAKALAIHLNRAAVSASADNASPAAHYAVVLGMDGFHLPTEVIQQRGLADRKGSEPTFDARGYLKLLASCRDPGFVGDLPVYDRRVHEPVYTGKLEDHVGQQTRVIITEGNYLLLDSLPWTAIDDMADLRLWLETPMEHSKKWLIRRHMAGGWSMERSVDWVKANDQLNAELILNQSRHADQVVRWPEAVYAQ